MNRNELIERIGADAVDRLERLNCDYTGRLLDNGGQEFRASLEVALDDGFWNAEVYYRQSNSDLESVENLDELDWIPDRYDMIPV